MESEIVFYCKDLLITDNYKVDPDMSANDPQHEATTYLSLWWILAYGNICHRKIANVHDHAFIEDFELVRGFVDVRE